jgi:hypothetical protein
VTEQVSPLRRRMIDDMTIRNMTPGTQKVYIRAVKNFSLFFERSPDELTFDDVREYHLHLIDEATERDPASAAAEYGAQFRTDVESFVNREAVEACVSVGVRERPPVSGVTYSAFVDPGGGSSDSMTLAIGHRQDDAIVIDVVRERRPPFSPEDVVLEFSANLNSYRISNVTGDRYGGEWPRERFREHGLPTSQR